MPDDALSHDTIIIGGWQAGLSVDYYLKKARRVLETLRVW
jgi:hypothetical protein